MNELAVFAPALSPKAVNGQRVVTFRDIDMMHKRPDGTARRNFYANKKHFVEGVDFYRVPEGCTDFVQGVSVASGTTLLTLTGYLMIVKSFTDDLSWAIQRELVTGYFAGRGRSFMGVPVMLLDEYCRKTGEPYGSAKERLREAYRRGRLPLGTALFLEGENLRLYNLENPQDATRASSRYILTAEGARRLYALGRKQPAE